MGGSRLTDAVLRAHFTVQKMFDNIVKSQYFWFTLGATRRYRCPAPTAVSLFQRLPRSLARAAMTSAKEWSCRDVYWSSAATSHFHTAISFICMMEFDWGKMFMILNECLNQNNVDNWKLLSHTSHAVFRHMMAHPLFLRHIEAWNWFKKKTKKQ